MTKYANVLAFWAFTAGQLLGQVPSQRELAGFVIGQRKEVLPWTFGSPADETKTEDGWFYRTHIVSEKPFVYMTFKFPADDLDHMISAQLAGAPNPEMPPFVGLHLGVSSSEVGQIFGSPSRIERVTDPAVDGLPCGDSQESQGGTRSARVVRPNSIHCRHDVRVHFRRRTLRQTARLGSLLRHRLLAAPRA